MELKKALQTLQSIDSNSGKRETLNLMVQVFNPNAIGGTPCVNVESINAGFDWDNGKVILSTEKQLTLLSSEDVTAIRESVSKGQSWHAYQSHKVQKLEVAGLQAKLVAGSVKYNQLQEASIKANYFLLYLNQSGVLTGDDKLKKHLVKLMEESYQSLTKALDM